MSRFLKPYNYISRQLRYNDPAAAHEIPVDLLYYFKWFAIFFVAAILCTAVFLYFWLYETHPRALFKGFWPSTQVAILIDVIVSSILAAVVYFPGARLKAVIAVNLEGKTIPFADQLIKNEMTKVSLVAYVLIVLTIYVLPCFDLTNFIWQALIAFGGLLLLLQLFGYLRLKLIRI